MNFGNSTLVLVFHFGPYSFNFGNLTLIVWYPYNFRTHCLFCPKPYKIIPKIIGHISDMFIFIHKIGRKFGLVLDLQGCQTTWGKLLSLKLLGPKWKIQKTIGTKSDVVLFSNNVLESLYKKCYWRGSKLAPNNVFCLRMCPALKETIRESLHQVKYLWLFTFSALYKWLIYTDTHFQIVS